MKKIFKRIKKFSKIIKKSLDFIKIELLIFKKIFVFKKDPDFEIINCKVVIRVDINKTQNRVYNFKNFSIEKIDRVLLIINAV